MNKLFMYSIFDVVAKDYGPIFEAKNDGVALRSFKHLVGSTGRPEEYKLYRLGSVLRSDDGLDVCLEENVLVEFEEVSNVEE
jgi:hypothetical protein